MTSEYLSAPCHDDSIVLNSHIKRFILGLQEFSVAVGCSLGKHGLGVKRLLVQH